MGHEIFVFRERHAIINDFDIWMMRHFLIVEAEASGEHDLAEFIRNWDWVGVGVYLGLDFDEYFGANEGRRESFLKLIDRTISRLRSFGEVVPLEYLAGNLETVHYTQAQPVERIIQQFQKLISLFAPS